MAALKKMKKLCCTRPKAVHLAGVVGEQGTTEHDGDRAHGAGCRGAEEDHRQVAEHVEEARLDAEQPQRQGVDHHRRVAAGERSTTITRYCQTASRLAEGVQDLAGRAATLPLAITRGSRAARTRRRPARPSATQGIRWKDLRQSVPAQAYAHRGPESR